MAMEKTGGEAEKSLEKVENETGISKEQQIKLIQDSILYAREMGTATKDILLKREETKQMFIGAELADRNSKRDFKLKNRQLDILENVLTHHFAERKTQIEGGFRIIDKALEENNWDAVTKIFSDMSDMVARSPLAEAIALNDKMKSGAVITLDDF